MDEHFSFTLHGSIDDAKKLRAKAIAMRRDDYPDVTDEEVIELFGTDDEPELSACIRYVLDVPIPGTGLQVNDSDCETY